MIQKKYILRTKEFLFYLALACINLVVPTTSMASEKMKVAIADLQAIGVEENMAKTTSELLRTELFKTGYFNIMERSQMEKLMSEQELKMVGITSDKDAARVGLMLSVQYFLIGSMNKLGGTYVINIRLVDVELGKLKAAETAEIRSSEQILEAVKQISKKITELTPIRGRVVRVKGKEVLVSLGSQDKVEPGMVLRVQRLGETFKEPGTGRVLGREIIEVANIRVNSVMSDELSNTTVMDEFGQIDVGDYAIIWSGGAIIPSVPKKRQEMSEPKPEQVPQNGGEQPKRKVPLPSF